MKNMIIYIDFLDHTRKNHSTNKYSPENKFLEQHNKSR